MLMPLSETSKCLTVVGQTTVDLLPCQHTLTPIFWTAIVSSSNYLLLQLSGTTKCLAADWIT